MVRSRIKRIKGKFYDTGTKNKTFLQVAKDLKQPGQFASTAIVSIKTEKTTLGKFRILGPCRSYTQVEVSRTDSFALGIDPPIRESGHLDGAAVVTIVGPEGEVTKPCCIIANRHIHITEEQAHAQRAQLEQEMTEKLKF